jgi:hypothetical protein
MLMALRWHNPFFAMAQQCSIYLQFFEIYLSCH